jgi:hypothetical protein
MKYFWSILIVLSFQLQILSAQPSKRANVWYFGDGVGLDFNYKPANALVGVHKMRPSEACATICDTSGRILLYTEGETIWNGKNQIITNGTGIRVQSTSAQGVLFIAHPGNDSLYYLFQASGYENDFGYSLINIYLDSGKGKVLLKNKRLLYTSYQNGEEKLTAINHANGRDIWVITHKTGTNEYYAYLVTANGLVDCPVVSKTGSVSNEIGNNRGYISISSDGLLISNPYVMNNAVEYLRFDPTSGYVAFEIVFVKNSLIPFSTCFTHDNKKSIINGLGLKGKINSVSVQKLELDSINASFNTIDTSKISYNEAVYKSPNGYLLINGFDSAGNDRIAQIDGLNKFMLAPFFQSIQVNLGAALPNFNQSYFYNPEIELYYTFNKNKGTLTLKPYDTFGNAVNKYLRVVKLYKNDSVQWVAKGDTSIHLIDTGLYRISYVLGNGKVKTKLLDNRIFIPINFLGTDTTVCPLNPIDIVLQAPKGMHCYHWSNGKSSDSIHIYKPGKYSVLLTLPSMLQVWDTIEVDTLTLAKPIDIIQKKDTLFALGGIPPFSWYKNAAFFKTTLVPYLKLDSNGTYVAMALDSFGCFPILDTFIVSNLKTRPTYLKPQFPILYYDNTWHIPSELSKSFFKLYDIKGSMLYMGQMEQLKNYSPPAGIIFLCISNSPYSKPYFQKLFIP